MLISGFTSDRNFAATPFVLPVITEAPSLEKLASLLTLMFDSSSCFKIALVIVSAFAEVDVSRRSLAARNLVLGLPVAGFTNFMNVTSCSLLETSLTSSLNKPNLVTSATVFTTVSRTTFPSSRNISLSEPADRC